MGRIVVGVDTSPARRALALQAAAEARLRQAVLQVVHATIKNLAAPVYFGSQHTYDASVGAAWVLAGTDRVGAPSRGVRGGRPQPG